MRILEIEARIENMEQVFAFLDEAMAGCDCPRKSRVQIRISVEEIFVNVASYAYGSQVGKVTILCDVTGDPPALVITFIDSGIPYNPLARTDPDVELHAEDRQIGGLGIYMAKKCVDDVSYEYKDGKNILVLKKKLSGI